MLRRFFLMVTLLILVVGCAGATDSQRAWVEGTYATVQSVRDYTQDHCPEGVRPCEVVRDTATLAAPVLADVIPLLDGSSRCEALKTAFDTATKVLDAIDDLADRFNIPNYLTAFLRLAIGFIPCGGAR